MKASEFVVVLAAAAALVAASANEVKEEEEEEPAVAEVLLPQGSLGAAREDIGSGRTIYAYKGIPYARPPVDHLRFRDPIPADGWVGLRRPFVAPPCTQALTQLLSTEVTITGEEDCLYLNVFTPAHPRDTTALPVMVFIHGGGFVMGDASSYGGTPGRLLRRDVILVSLQYRLGALGFMSTEDAELPGNLGLKDQALALKWVHNNIVRFGGDPQRVTLFGVSAGGVSVHLQLLNPETEGLFQRAILQSGSALCPWAVSAGGHRRLAGSVGSILGCEGVSNDEVTDSASLVNCLRNADVVQLATATTKDRQVWAKLPFAPVPRVDGQVLPAHPAQLVREGRYHKVDLISGVTAHETAFWIALGLHEPNAFVDKFSTVAPISLSLEEEPRALYLARRLFHHYLPHTSHFPVTPDTAEGFLQLFSDILYKVPHEQTAEFHARDGLYGRHTFLYQLDHRGSSSLTSMVLGAHSDVGKHWVSHGDDIQYLFCTDNTTFCNSLTSPDDLLLSQIMMHMWTNFAEFGDPTPDMTLGFRWTPATPTDLSYLSLTPAPTMKPDTRAQTREFLHDLPTVTNQLLYPERFNPHGQPQPQPCGSCLSQGAAREAKCC